MKEIAKKIRKSSETDNFYGISDAVKDYNLNTNEVIKVLRFFSVITSKYNYEN